MTIITASGVGITNVVHLLGQLSNPDRATGTTGYVFTFEDVALDRFLNTWSHLTASNQALYAWNVAVGLIGHSSRMVEEHISQVLAAAEGFHAWCLGSGQKPELGERLKALYNSLPEAVTRQLQLNVEHWSGWAVWARNHVDHGGAKQHREVSDFFALKSVADSVHLVTYLAALQQFGVSEVKIAQAMITNVRLSALVERCSDLNFLPRLT